MTSRRARERANARPWEQANRRPATGQTGRGINGMSPMKTSPDPTHEASTLVLAAVLMAPNRRSCRIDVMATYMRVVHAMALPIEPENWGPSIKGMRARELVNDDIETIIATASLGTFYEVPHEYAHAAEAAWRDA